MSQIVLNVNRPLNGQYGTKTEGIIALKKMGILVPDFWCIDKGEFDKFVSTIHIPSFYDFLMSEFDASIEEKIMNYAKGINLSMDFDDGCYIVRSSSVPHGMCLNYASIISGAFESYECGKEDIGVSVAKVYASLYSKKAYMQLKSSGANIVEGMSVLIQKYVAPLCSGVIHYYVEKDTMDVDWVFGHLREIVSGNNEGIHFKLFKDGHDIIIRGHEKDIYEVDERQLGCVFISLYDNTIKAGKTNGTNLEIEWLYDGQQLFFVQSQELIDI